MAFRGRAKFSAVANSVRREERVKQGRIIYIYG